MKNNKGYLLIEMMIGSAIIVVTLVALLQLFMTFSVTVREARQQSIATSHAQFVLEEIKNLSRWSIYTAPPNEWDFDEGSISEKGMTPLPNESIDTQVSLASPPGMLGIQILVRWGSETDPRTSVLETRIYQ